MSHRKQTIALISSGLALALSALPFEVGPLMSLSGFDLVRGSLSGGTWSIARIALALLLATVIAVLAWATLVLIFRRRRDN